MKKTYDDAQMRILEKTAIECEDVVAHLDDYVEGDLGSTLKGRFDGHLFTCQNCDEVHRTYTLTVELATELRERPIPTDVQRRLREALNRRLGINLPTAL